MNPEYKSHDYSVGYKSEFEFECRGITVEQALIIERAKQDGILSKSEAYSLASLIDQGIIF